MSNTEDRTLQDVKRTIAFALAIPSYLTGIVLVKGGSEGLTDSGFSTFAIAEIVAGAALMAVLLVCAFYMMHGRLPSLKDVEANGQ